MNDTISIRRLGVDDWQAFKDMRLEALQTNQNVFLGRYEKESAEPDSFWQDTLINRDKGAVFGLYDGQTMIGLTGVFRYRDSPEDTAILAMSFIRPEYRRRGLSTHLYEARIDWAKSQNGIQKIIVSHRGGNEASRAANQKFGFVYTGQNEENYPDGKSMQQHYQLDLRSP